MPSPDALARSDAPAISRTGMRVVLLDIEGTTCPVSFVSGTLFPYARQAMEGFLAREAQGRADVRRLLEAVAAAWRDDQHPEAIALRKRHPDHAAAYLRQLIDRDSKLPALKELQGLVWRAGYASGELVAPLFADVAPTLRRWKAKGLELGVYSSGSITAQQLLYRHSNAGDLSGLFSHWFDTHVGPKQESASYAAIARSVLCKANEVLFISDAVAECTAAQAAGMEVVFSSRDGNPQSDSCGFAAVSNFGDLIILT